MNLYKSLFGVAVFSLLASFSYGQTTFLTGFALNGPPVRNDFGDFVGMQLTVGAKPLSVSAVGRVCLTGNSQSHTVKFVVASGGADVPGGSASVNMAGCTPGQFVYQPLSSAITLAANTAYFLVSQEIYAGDRWYDFGTVTSTSDAAVNSSVYHYNGNYLTLGGPNSSYVPPNFQYTVSTPPPLPGFVQTYTAKSPRNDYTGFVGMRLTVGTNPLTVSALGRVCLAGNTQTHTVKFVAANGTDVPGATAAVSMAGCTPGAFKYTTLGSPVTLNASTSYFLVSSETTGGDQWYDQGPVTSKADATVNSSVYTNGSTYVPIGSASTSYVPPDFEYSTSTGTCNVTVGTNPATGLSFTVDTMTYTSAQTFSWTCGSTHSISTASPQNVGGGSQQVFSSWSDSGAISHSVTPTSSTTYTATFTTQYLLTNTISPVGTGTISAVPPSATGYYNSGTSVQLTATPGNGNSFGNWSQDLSGTANPQSITMSAPHNVTANFTTPPPITVTVQTSLPGLTVTVDGTSYPTPYVFMSVPGSQHTITTSSPQSLGAGSQAVFSSWSDNGALSHTVSPTVSTTYRATFNTQYLLTTNANPPGGGSIVANPLSATGYYNSGTLVQLTATANSGYTFQGFSGGLAGTTNPQSILITEPQSVTANFTTLAITVNTSPANLSFTVDGTTYTSAQTFSWAPGSQHTIATTSPQSPSAGTQNIFTSWSDTGAISHTVSPVTSTTYTANFSTQYLLTTNVSPANSGTIAAIPSSGNGYYAAGTSVQLTATPSNGSTFLNFSGDLTGATNPQSITMSAPHTVTANFQPNLSVTAFVTSPTPTTVLRNDYPGWVGMQLTIGANPVNVVSLGRICVAGNSQTHTVKFVLASTSADVPGASATVNMAGCTGGSYVFTPISTVTLTPNTRYYLVSQENVGGDLWYEQGPVTGTSVATINSSLYGFAGVYDPINTTNTSYVPPNFQYSTGCSATPISVTVGTNPSTNLFFSVDGTQYSSTQTFNWTACQSHTIATTSPQANSLPVGTQLAFSNWSDGGTISHTVTPTGPASYTANFTTQYLLTTNVNPAGSGNVTANPPSATGYYNAGTSVQLTATPIGNNTFQNWSGGLSGSTNPQSITMTAPQTVSANFVTGTQQPQFITSFTATHPRIDVSGFIGMQLTVGAAPLNVYNVGRVCVPGNNGTHVVKFVFASSGADVPNGSASVPMSGCSPGQFVYEPVAVVLQANTNYYLVSQETAGGDAWYDQGAVTAASGATVKGPVYQSGANYVAINSPNTAYVPPNFEYNILPAPSSSAYVTAYALSTPELRNDFTGLVGMKLTIGASPLTATQLGRVCVAGNSLSHLIEFVNPSNNQVVGSATVNMAGCTPGQFAYAAPSSPIQLQANTTYYLASQETGGGDQWYDAGTVATTNVAAVNSPEYAYLGSWYPGGGPNASYVPPNFIYAKQATPILSISPSRAPNVYDSNSSWPGYLVNAISALKSGATSIGNPATDPTAYFQVTQENQEQNIVSGFPSWLGSASPTGAFANESGNRIHFGLHIIGNGTQFSLSQLAFDVESTDSSDTFQYTGNFSDTTDPTNNYSTSIVGLNYGPDRIKGTADDFYVTSGLPTQVVDELFFVGIGVAISPDDVGTCSGSNQAQLDCVASYYDSIMPFNLSIVYSLNGATAGSAVVPFIQQPSALLRSSLELQPRIASPTGSTNVSAAGTGRPKVTIQTYK